MNEFGARSSSALVVAERKGQRPGGCVGFFFKLFDWNRRFGKKQLLPKKLIAPARANQVSKKFNADEKLPMPKHFLIADKNGGQFPCTKKAMNRRAINPEQRREMRSPGLVAKLMGLESMPIVEAKSPDNTRHGSKSDKGSPRHEVQPQKIQKTGLSERRPVSRFGVDGLQIRNALSRSRKRHPKLISPVKSPRVARNSSRLRDAAARILEPGLQATSRARCTLTYPDSMVWSTENEVNRREDMIIESSEQSRFEMHPQISCQSCAHGIDPMDSTSDPCDMHTINVNNALFQRVEESKPRVGIRYQKESEVVLLRSRYQPEAQAHAKFSSGVHQRRTIPNTMHRSPYSQNQWDFPDNTSFHCDGSSHSQFVRGDRVPPRSRRVSSPNAVNATKNFIALNRNVSQSRPRLPRKPSNFTEVRRQQCVPKDDAPLTERNFARRRAAAVGRQVESNSFSRQTVDRQRSLKSKATSNLKSVNPSFVKSRSVVEGGSRVSESKDIDVVSFSFSSPLKSKSQSFFQARVDDKRVDQSDFSNNGDASEQTKGDAIGALLEQKLKELTHQAEEESATGIMPQGRSTASILQELISALTEERPVSPDINDSLSSDASMISRNVQGAEAKKPSLRSSGDHFSPGSVLDASFSNESCLSSSRDDCSGQMLQSDNMELSYDQPQLSPHPDADLIDSASSTTTKYPRTNTNFTISHFVDRISTLLEKSNFPKPSPAQSTYTKEILLNTELLFGNVGQSQGFITFLIGPFLDELEALAAAAWRSTVILGFDISPGNSQSPLRRFLFDCLVECLHVRYDRYCNSGFRSWRKLQRQMSMEDLLQAFDYEVRRWASMASMSQDEAVEWEMSSALGKWLDFDVEVFESGAETGEEILESLLGEIVADFL